MMLSDVCVSVAYSGSKSRTESHRKTKTGTEVAHVIRDSDTTFQVTRSQGQRSRSPGRFTHRGVKASGCSCSSDCRNVLTVGTYCYVAVCRRGRLDGARRFGAHKGRRGVGHIVAASRTACCFYVA